MPFDRSTPIKAETLIRNIPSILLVFDNRADLVTWNTAAAKALGLGPAPAPARRLAAPLTSAVRSCIEKGISVRVDQCAVRVGETDRLFGFNASPICQEGQCLGAVATGRDITESVRIDEEVDDLRRRAGIEKVARQVTHALRNPLNAIKAHAQFIELTFPVDDPSRHYAEVIVEEVDRMDRLLTSLRDLSRVEEMELRLQSPEEAIRSAYDIIRPVAEAKGVDLAEQIEPLPEILQDDVRLQQVFLNLLKNAVEAVDFGGRACIRAVTQPNGGICVDVLDDGPGIDSELSDRIFDLFFTTKGRMSQGVGLALCQEIIERHRGTISLCRDPDWTTCFRVEIPPP
jgi:signal transduction histidine kinase